MNRTSVRSSSALIGGGSVSSAAPTSRRASTSVKSCGSAVEPRAALGIGRAAGEDLLERALRLASDVGPERERRRHDAVEHDRAYALRVLPQVVLRDARAVRHAVDVPSLDAERRAHVLEVANGDRGRVEARVVLELRGAGVDDARELLGARGIERQVLRNVAGEALGGPAGAALVDEDQLSVAARRLERAAHLQVEVHGALPGTARDQEQRIGTGLGAERPEPRDEDLDRRAIGRRRIERHLERAAARIGRGHAVGREAAARLALPLGLRGRRNAGQGEHRGDEQQRPALPHSGACSRIRRCSCQRYNLSILGGQAAAAPPRITPTYGLPDSLRLHRRRRRPCRHRSRAGVGPHGRAHAALDAEPRNAGADELQPGDRRHRQRASDEGDRRARRRHGAGDRSRRNSFPHLERQQGTRRARDARAGGPRALQARDSRAARRRAEPDLAAAERRRPPARRRARARRRDAGRNEDRGRHRRADGRHVPRRQDPRRRRSTIRAVAPAIRPRSASRGGCAIWGSRSAA